MKTILAGAQGVGKSTILAGIEEDTRFSHYTLIKEVVRTLMRQGVKINKGADHDSQVAIFTEHHKNILRHEDFISDRGALDAFVYATWDYLQGNYTYAQHKEHERIFLDCMPYYDQIFFIPVEFAISPDGVRETDVNYQREINDLFIKIIAKYNIDAITIKGTNEQRVKHITEILAREIF